MSRALRLMVVSMALAVASASLASADSLVQTRSPNSFTSNDSIHWGMLGVNNFFVPNGSTLSTSNGISTTVSFWTGGSGATLEQCPTTTCSWTGNFAPGDELLTDLNFNTGGSSGRIILSFATGISGIGFQLEPNVSDIYFFATEIAVYDGGILLGTFYSPDGREQLHAENNSAGFYGVTDLTGANITSIQVLAYNCGGSGVLCQGFAINQARIEDGVEAAAAATPEPGSLALFGSGLGLLGFLRRKLAARQ